MSEQIIIPDDGTTTVIGNEVHHHHHHYRSHNNANLTGKWGVAALSAITGGVLTWAAMHSGFGGPGQNVAPPPPAPSAFHDGTYTGAGHGVTGGDVIVTITVANGVITNVDAQYPNDWEGNADAIPQLIAESKAAQSAHITNVTGSTVTSDAFKGSLQDAINQASGAGGGVVAAPLPAPAPETAAPAPAPETAHATLHDGLFFGAGYISSGGPNPQNTYVTMRVVDGKIVGVSATYPLGNEESERISGDAIPQLVTEAKEKQSADLTNVTGATNSSGAFKQSLQDAINQSVAGTSTAAPLGNVTDGTFAGHPASTGRAGDAIVTITVAGGHITEVTAVMPEHSWGDPEISNEALIPVLADEAVQTQSAHLTNITGATGSTTAFITSLQSAINQARGN